MKNQNDPIVKSNSQPSGLLLSVSTNNALLTEQTSGQIHKDNYRSSVKIVSPCTETK